jgi:hypothetical protein
LVGGVRQQGLDASTMGDSHQVHGSSSVLIEFLNGCDGRYKPHSINPEPLRKIADRWLRDDQRKAS